MNSLKINVIQVKIYKSVGFSDRLMSLGIILKRKQIFETIKSTFHDKIGDAPSRPTKDGIKPK